MEKGFSDFFLEALYWGAVLLGLKYLIIEVGYPLYSLIREIIIGGINLSDLISLFILLFSLFVLLLPALYLVLKAKGILKESEEIYDKATKLHADTKQTNKESRTLLNEIKSKNN